MSNTTGQRNAELQLNISVRPSVTVLPRCLQILSRRGFMLTSLNSRQNPDGTMSLACTIIGPKRWHGPIVRLLERPTDVVSVENIAAQPGGSND